MNTSFRAAGAAVWRTLNDSVRYVHVKWNVLNIKELAAVKYATLMAIVCNVRVRRSPARFTSVCRDPAAQMRRRGGGLLAIYTWQSSRGASYGGRWHDKF